MSVLLVVSQVYMVSGKFLMCVHAYRCANISGFKCTSVHSFIEHVFMSLCEYIGMQVHVQTCTFEYRKKNASHLDSPPYLFRQGLSPNPALVGWLE